LTIKQLLEDAIEYDQIELQALILYAVAEDKSCSMDDDKSVLNKYFTGNQPHNKVVAMMNKNKMNPQKGVYEVRKTSGTIYVYANDRNEALYRAKGIDAVKLPSHYQLDVNGQIKTVRELTVGRQAPSVLGAWENQYKQGSIQK